MYPLVKPHERRHFHGQHSHRPHPPQNDADRQRSGGVQQHRINKIDSMLRSPNCPFVLFVGTKKPVKRREFEEYISQKLVI